MEKVFLALLIDLDCELLVKLNIMEKMFLDIVEWKVHKVHDSLCKVGILNILEKML